MGCRRTTSRTVKSLAIVLLLTCAVLAEDWNTDVPVETSAESDEQDETTSMDYDQESSDPSALSSEEPDNNTNTAVDEDEVPTSLVDSLPQLPVMEFNFSDHRTRLFQAENKVFRRLSERQLEVGVQELYALASALDTILPTPHARQYHTPPPDENTDDEVQSGLDQDLDQDLDQGTTDTEQPFDEEEETEEENEQLQQSATVDANTFAAAEGDGPLTIESTATAYPEDEYPHERSLQFDVASQQFVYTSSDGQFDAAGTAPGSLPDSAHTGIAAGNPGHAPLQPDASVHTVGAHTSTSSDDLDRSEVASAIDSEVGSDQEGLAAGDAADGTRWQTDGAPIADAAGTGDIDKGSAAAAAAVGDDDENGPLAEEEPGAEPVNTAALEEAQGTSIAADVLPPEYNIRKLGWQQLGEPAVISGAEAAAGALFDLAILASTGVAEPHVKKDPLWAHLALHRAASFDSMEAQLSLADRYFFGRGVDASCRLGMRYAKLAARMVLTATEKDQSHLEPFNPVRLRERWMRADYYNDEEFQNSKAMVMMEEDLAIRGNAEAQRRLAYRRLVGNGVEADPAAAFRDFQAAAVQGDVYAIFNLGYMYLKGLHVPANATIAKDYFEESAQKGLAAGYNGVGVLHYNGHGMPRNVTAAREAFEKGAALNNSDCLYNLGSLYQEVELDEEKALHYYQRAHDTEHWRAAYNLALLHDESAVGGGCEVARGFILQFVRNKKSWQHELQFAIKAIDYGDHFGALVRFLIVAEQGSEVAAANAAWMLLQRQGHSGPGAGDLAANLLKRSARHNGTDSLVQLATLCMEQQPPLQVQRCGQREAALMLEQAVRMGSVEGALNLAWVHWRGFGVAENSSMAGSLYYKAFQMSSWESDGLVALLALWGFRLLHLLSLLFGKGLILQLLDGLAASTQQLGRVLGSLAESSTATAVGLARRDAGLYLKEVGMLLRVVLLEMQADQELMTIGLLVAALLAVLWLRRYQQRVLQERQQNRQYFTVPAQNNNAAAAAAAPTAMQQPIDGLQGGAVQLPQGAVQIPQGAVQVPPGEQPSRPPQGAEQQERAE